METLEQHSTDAAENVGLDPMIEAQMAADEAEWAKEEGRSGRDDRGRFTGATEEGQRAGQAPAADGKGADEELPPTETESEARSGEREARSQQEATQQEKPAGEQVGKGAEGKAEAEAAKPDVKPGSAWQRENERKHKTWEGINQTKAELAAEREQLKLEREQFVAQQGQASAQTRDSSGHTASDYERFAQAKEARVTALTQQALAAEQAGRFDEADRLNAKAGEEATLAKAAADRVIALKASGPGNVWAKLSSDLPEAMQFNGPINVELRKVLRTDPALLGDPFGPYRAAVKVGRSVLQATEQKLATAQAEAAKVPQLTKQIEELSARVKELQSKTSLTRGGAAISRGSGEGRAFADLSVEEMEAQLAAEANA